MNAAAKPSAKDDDDVMESESDSDDDQRKHSALTRQGAVPRKAKGKGGAGKS